jgi:hypothetical protein
MMEPSNDREKEFHRLCAPRGRTERKNITTQNTGKGRNVLFMSLIYHKHMPDSTVRQEKTGGSTLCPSKHGTKNGKTATLFLYGGQKTILTLSRNLL